MKNINKLEEYKYVRKFPLVQCERYVNDGMRERQKGKFSAEEDWMMTVIALGRCRNKTQTHPQ